MAKSPSTCLGVLVLLVMNLAGPPARAVIFYSTTSPAYNATAPTGSLAGSGWQWTGTWGGYEGTPIGPYHFLTAHHVGGNVGDPFVFAGVAYTTTAYFDDPVSDLRIWEVSGSFPTWAPIYRQSAEVGQNLVVIGAGVGAGAPVMVDGALKGWIWGSTAGVTHWGQNTFAGDVDGGSYWGDLLYATFNAGAGPNEADLALGDSSSPTFINDGTGWTLAGVGAAVDGPFNTTDTGAGFNAAIFDARGLYINGPNWVVVTGTSPVPTGFYATRVSVRAAWIDSIVPSSVSGDTPLLSPGETAVLAVALAGLGAWYSGRKRPAEPSA